VFRVVEVPSTLVSGCKAAQDVWILRSSARRLIGRSQLVANGSAWPADSQRINSPSAADGTLGQEAV